MATVGREREQSGSTEASAKQARARQHEPAEWLVGGGEMGDLIRSTDWAATPLGPRADWPPSLRVALGICLNSRFPMFIWWGPEFINLYNDAYVPLLGKRHPRALGHSAPQIWGELWAEVGPLAEQVMHRGESTWSERHRFVVERNGYPEEAFFTFSHGPVRDGAGHIGGVICAVHEETARVLAERERLHAEEQPRRILESITDAFFSLDREWGFTYLNPQAERVLNRQPGEVIGKDIWAEYPGLLGSSFERAYRKTHADQVPTTATEFYPDHDRWYEVRVYPAPDGGISVYFRDITEQKRAEETFRQLAERFEQHSRLFEQIASATLDFIYVFDLEGRFRYANRRLLEVWGRTFEEAYGKSLYELGYPQWHADMHVGEIRQVIETRQPIKGEVPFTGGSGISGVYEYIFTPVIGPGGQVEVIAGTTRDVTDRRRIERESADAKAAAEAGLARWQAVIANMAEGVVVADRDGNMIEWNRAALDMHGYASVDDARKTVAGAAALFRVTSPADGTVLPPQQWPVPRLLRGEAFHNWELRVQRLDGPVDLVISYSGTPVRDRTGNVALAVLTLHDVTGERLAQRALAESELHFRDTFEQSPIGIAINDLDGRYVHVNAAYCRLVGYAREELLDPSFGSATLAHADDRPRVLALQRQVLAGQIPSFLLEKRYVRKDGSTVWVRVTGTARRDADGRPTQFIRLVEDIDDRKRAEAEREQLLSSERFARAEAERQGRMKDEFLSTLSHELRTPLNAILGWASILRAGNGAGAPAPDEQDLREGLEVIERNARAQTQIVEDLLDMSRIISGKIRLDVQRLDLATVVAAAIDTVRPAAEAKGVRIQAVLDPQAGPVSGDPSRLQQVFWNLLSNACKFTPRGGRIQVLLERVNSHLEVSVIDTGEGIKPEFLPFVFDRFRQADASTTRRHGGLGLGLSIVRQLVELHGGTARARSAGPGSGSTFSVSLPLTVIHPEPELAVHGGERRHPEATHGPPQPDESRLRLRGVRVLVVDDEPDARSLVRRVLEDCEALVATAASAEEAFQHLTAERPDVLVSDIGMPGEDGYSLIRRIRALGKERGGDVPAVALTAYARAEDRIRAITAGFQHHVAKPVEPAELIAMVASLAQSTA